MNAPTPRYPARVLNEIACTLLTRAGLPDERARDVAEVLLEGDLLGHSTHGLGLLALYLQEIKDGRMLREGAPTVVADHDSAVTWDGNYLPGPWLVRRAIATARERLARHPIATVVIARSHHIACLQAFLKPVTDAGLMIVLFGSDPANRWVAPFGAVEPVYSPDPLAVGIPTAGDPVLVDMSASTTAAGQCIRAAKSGTRLPGKWLVDRAGNLSDDPAPVVQRREGALLPLGGADLGYKGFGLALFLEAITSGLAGHGRADGNARWGCSVFLQLIDPARFGGAESFLRETTFLGAACRAAAVPEGRPRVRLPGERALARRAEQLAHGVELHPDVIPALAPWARELGVALPETGGARG